MSEPVSHWWSIFDLQPKKEIFFFYTFGIVGLKTFIDQDNQKIIEKILLGIEKMKKADNKLTLIKIKLAMENYKKLTKKEISRLSNSEKTYFISLKNLAITK